MTGPITSGGTHALVLTTTGSGDTLKLDASGSAAKTVTLNGGTLLMNGSSASLTVSDALAVGAGTVQLSGTSATLTDSNGATLTTGTITGFGQFRSEERRVGNEGGHITAKGGT